jgi:hypothetical protein
MKKLLAVLLMFVVAFGASSANAQSKMSLGVGADVLLPMGDWGDFVSTGFGGTVRFQYNLSPMGAIGAETGYLLWTGKDVSAGGFTFEGPDFTGIPIRVFGKYYFMPEGKLRVYGLGALGLFIGSTGDQEIDNPLAGIPGQPAKITVEGESSSDFNYVACLGFELPLGGGGTMLDVSARWDAIATEGTSANNIGFRAGVNFPLGN